MLRYYDIIPQCISGVAVHTGLVQKYWDSPRRLNTRQYCKINQRCKTNVFRPALAHMHSEDMHLAACNSMSGPPIMHSQVEIPGSAAPAYKILTGLVSQKFP